MGRKHNRFEIMWLIVLLIAIVTCSFFFLKQKSGYYTDEGMTLFLANGHYNGAVTSRSEYDIADFIKNYIWSDEEHIGDAVTNVIGMLKSLKGQKNYSSEKSVEWYDSARRMLQGSPGWVSGRELYEEITVSRETRFDFKQVYFNQAVDVHPVIYYVLINLIFSLTAGTFSNVYLWLINIIFLIGSCIILFFIVNDIWGDKYWAFFSVSTYGLSQGCMSCSVYFRMYAVLTFFVILIVYIHLKILDIEQNWIMKKKNRIFLILCVLLGANTHYYFLVVLFPLFLISSKCLWKNSKLRKKYIQSVFIAGIFSIIFWPFSVYHILFGYRGKEAWGSITDGGIILKIKELYCVFRDAFFGGQGWILGLFALISMIFFAQAIRNRKCTKETSLLLFTTVFYSVVIVKVAPVVSDRYFMCIYPLVSIAIGYMFALIIKRIRTNDRYKLLLALSMCIVWSIVSIGLVRPNYLYTEQKSKCLEIEGLRDDYNCLMIGLNHGQGFSEVLKLCQFNNVLVTGIDEIKLEEIEFPDSNRGQVLYVYDQFDQEEILDRFLDKKRYVQVSSDIESFNAYLVWKDDLH